MTDAVQARPDGDAGIPPPRPAPPRPLIPTPWEVVGTLWRRLRRMSTALALLFALAVATLIATFVPQEPVIVSTVRLWRTGEEGPGEAVARVMDALSLFDVFGSWWFAGLTALLFVSLTGCLVPRWRVFLRNVRRPPARGGGFARLHHHVRFARPVGVSDEEVLAAAERVLRFHRRRRVVGAAGHPQLAVERGHWRELGSLVFHTSFYLLLIGMALGAGYSFTGQIDIAEGGRFADTPVGYDTSTSGSLWDTSRHAGHVTTLEDFEVTYLPDGFTPDEYTSTVTFTDADGTTTTEQIRVNHPAHHNGLTYYQRAFGFAPRLVVRSGLDGTPLFDDRLILRQDGGFWVGRGKLSVGSADPAEPLPQIAVEVLFLPDAEFAEDGTVVFRSPQANDPRMLVTLYVGEDLGLDRTVPLSQLEWPEEAAVDRAMVVPGEPIGMAPVAGGALFEVEFADLSLWSGLQVSHQPYRWLLLTAASLTLMGLVPSLYAYRRRIWVEVHDDHIDLAGVAQHRKDRFEVAFAEIAERLGAALGTSELPPGDAPPAAPPPVDASPAPPARSRT